MRRYQFFKEDGFSRNAFLCAPSFNFESPTNDIGLTEREDGFFNEYTDRYMPEVPFFSQSYSNMFQLQTTVIHVLNSYFKRP